MRPDGTFQIDRIGLRPSPAQDLYHFLLTTRWIVFLGLLVGIYLGANVGFAYLYSLDPSGITNSRPHSITDAFFFSIQTMSTVGYGYFMPKSPYAHFLMVIESIFGFLFTAVSTGLVFAKFSRVRARVMFSREALIHDFDGIPVLTLRTANQRSSQILDASIRLTLARDEFDSEGRRHRKLHSLKLQRESTPLFALVWNVYHTIDENSPLWGQTSEELRTNMTALFVTFNGMDDALTMAMHTRYAYNPTEILFNRRFKDIIGQADNGRRFIDYRDFHETVALPPSQWLRWSSRAHEASQE